MRPLDLEAALRGEPVKLRNGDKAVVIGRIPGYISTSYPLRGFTVNGYDEPASDLSWTPDGVWQDSAIEEEYDIIGMWEEPPKTVSINGHEFPQPLREAPRLTARYWEVFDFDDGWAAGAAVWHDTRYDRKKLRLGFAHATEEAAKAHADALNAVHKELLE